MKTEVGELVEPQISVRTREYTFFVIFYIFTCLLLLVAIQQDLSLQYSSIKRLLKNIYITMSICQRASISRLLGNLRQPKKFFAFELED